MFCKYLRFIINLPLLALNSEIDTGHVETIVYFRAIYVHGLKAPIFYNEAHMELRAAKKIRGTKLPRPN